MMGAQSSNFCRLDDVSHRAIQNATEIKVARLLVKRPAVISGSGSVAMEAKFLLDYRKEIKRQSS
jgi:hypothetical protein